MIRTLWVEWLVFLSELLFCSLGFFYGYSSPTSKRNLIQLIMFSLILNKPIKNKVRIERWESLRRTEKCALSVFWDELVTVARVKCPFNPYMVKSAKCIEMAKVQRSQEEIFGFLGMPFIFQVPLWIGPDPLHIQPLSFPLRLGVRLLLGGILPRAPRGIQVELLRSVYLFCRLRGLQVRASFGFTSSLRCIYILTCLSFFLITVWCFF